MVNSTVGMLYQNIKETLKLAGIENFKQEASLLLCKVCGLHSYQIATKSDMLVEEEKITVIENFVDRRKNGEPLQYILGEWEFFGLDFKVGEGVLIPRQDTETLVEVAIDYAKEFDNPTIADLCSGSGCIAISLEKNINKSNVFAVELSEKAINYLNKNIEENNSNAKIISGDVCKKKTLEKLPKLDIIVSNPPYLTTDEMNVLQREVQFEPSMALVAGDDGLDFYRKISSMWYEKLNQNGIIAFECGINQHQSIKEIFEQNGYIDICFKEDLCGIIRVVSARKK